ncbi:carbohydrate-binding module family 48 protein [Neurospora crassa]|uniref:Snf1 kinase complex beta-subunit Gal83 n=1 Tax=Neurospora crassa (strain ATCC 24698 / 74-OR23-1A / CBS 708.71 / DSM 1257 / FGSC 987) TaxID=367110 RepID=Q7S744_NEUCR|nr:Snf1 kinase complex beta-subunit Gal83 [Neurospora crassa OR74A]EAA31360.1 Snf1 kinase complex beta-subunit Gal83 [Neurospora crassa OR74A]KHE88092.1 carbohydrate-binding module family 48 protein [Neurospora crassa]|eukprot:XP_960596.1 Snf1 kinase complex beta-subunit Gal83 [Neurospora crassa OR74A]
MGNNPSTSRDSKTPNPQSSSSSSQSQSQHQSLASIQNDSARAVKRDTKHPIPVPNQRVAAPPEPSLTQAQGTAVQPPSTTARPKSLHSRMPPSQSGSPGSSVPTSSATPTKPVEVRQLRPEDSHEPAKPVAVPTPCHASSCSPRSPVRSPLSERSDAFETAAMQLSSLQDVSYLTRPPRLPLPIEEEVHTPGSPIIAPTDIGVPLEDADTFTALTRRSSNLSNSSTLDEEDTEELRVDKTRPTVPTRLEWLRGGEKVYVTGTIFQWNRKTRLHPVEGRPGVFAAIINILPGTHHVRFLVDGQMQTSPDLPTTVDFGNNLVNYIEVSPDDVGRTAAQAAAASAAKDSQQPTEPKTSASETEESKAPRDRPVPPAELFENKIPQYLLDFDAPEESPPYLSAVNAIEKLPTPPALPGFLGKPILNAATLIKDDNSVLNMPNHTVLNHLATSSIKNNILAVSATTRYKNKYVTTIMYKPTTTEGI